MGWFETAYVIEGRETDDGVAFTISVYGDTGSRRDGGVRIRSLFSWAPGARPAGTPSYANGTLFSEETIGQVAFLSRTEERGQKANETAELCLLQQSYQTPESVQVLVHILLPPRWVPRASLKPLIQPGTAEIVEHPGEQLAITYPTHVGNIQVAFWIEKLAKDAKLRDYEVTQLLVPPLETETETTAGFSLFGFLKGERKWRERRGG